MRVLSLIPVLAAFGSFVTASSCTNEIDCGSSKKLELPFRDGYALTNAELLRRGLPLKGPVMRRGSPVRRTIPSSVPSGPVQYTGVIQVIQSGSGSVLGYLSNTASSSIVYSNSIANALVVTFQTDSTGSGTHLDFSIVGTYLGYPYLGLVPPSGATTLTPGSYVVLAGIASPGSETPTVLDNSWSHYMGPQRPTETAVWSFNSATGALNPQWLNHDGSVSPSSVFVNGQNVVYVGDGIVTSVGGISFVTLHFVPT